MLLQRKVMLGFHGTDLLLQRHFEGILCLLELCLQLLQLGGVPCALRLLLAPERLQHLLLPARGDGQLVPKAPRELLLGRRSEPALGIQLVAQYVAAHEGSLDFVGPLRELKAVLRLQGLHLLLHRRAQGLRGIRQLRPKETDLLGLLRAARVQGLQRLAVLQDMTSAVSQLGIEPGLHHSEVGLARVLVCRELSVQALPSRVLFLQVTAQVGGLAHVLRRQSV
mmetsp:Transcript_3936/g.11955  ORF Transcript_3936/g.11955 Transcript_3936/m.11955 type:complete len:224 (+) Transcript_3936:591-1262(+)